MKLLKAALAGALVAGTLLAQSAAPAFAEPEFKITYAEFSADRGPRAAELRRWADEINARTDGRVEVDFHFGGSLLSSKDVLHGVRGGIADMGTIVASNNAAEMPLWTYGGRPLNEGDTWVGIMTWAELAKTNPIFMAEFERNGVKHLLQNGAGPDGLICRETAPTTEEELQGLKIRGSGGVLPFLEELGANVVSITTTDLYSALDRGIIDCSNFAIPYIQTYKFYEVADTVINADLAQAFYYGGVMNLDFWNELPADIQATIEEVSAEYNERLAKGVVEEIAKVKTALQEGVDGHKMTFHEVDPAEKANWARHTDAVNTAWRERAKAYASDEEIDAFMAQVEETRAKYASMRDANGYPWAPN